MVIDRELLNAATATAKRAADAERQAELARSDYHTAIRRLHLAGASLREIAAALDVSHQRVQQIVDAAGGSWWRRGWGTRSRQPDAGCLLPWSHNVGVPVGGAAQVTSASMKTLADLRSHAAPRKFHVVEAVPQDGRLDPTDVGLQRAR